LGHTTSSYTFGSTSNFTKGGTNTLIVEKRNLHLNKSLKKFYNLTFSKKKFPNINLKMNSKKDNINGLQIIDLILHVLARKKLGKREKSPGNHLSLKLLKNKIIYTNEKGHSASQ
jgi:hypothetical protein